MCPAQSRAIPNVFNVRNVVKQLIWTLVTQDNLVKVAGLLVHARRQDIAIGTEPNPDGKNNYLFNMRFRCLDMPNLTSAC